jgi:hypothetical protein
MKSLLTRSLKPISGSSILKCFSIFLTLFLLFNATPLSAQNLNAPVITWENPILVKSKTNSKTISIKAIISSPFELQNVQISINGIFGASVSKELIKEADGITYILEKTIELNTGNNTVFIMAGNSKGVTNSGNRIISFVDGTAPVITLITPVKADSINGTGIAVIQAEIISNLPIELCRLNHNDKFLPGEKLEKQSNTLYRLEKRINLLTGINTIYLEVSNAAGLAETEKRTIIFSREPSIRWILPVSDNFTSKSASVTIKAEVSSPFELQNTLINLNGNLLGSNSGTLSPINANSYLFEGSVDLVPGKNSISLTAGSAKGVGNSSTKFISFQLPEVTLISPSAIDSFSTTGTAVVKAEVVSATPVQSAKIFINGRLFIGPSPLRPQQKDNLTYTIESQVPLQFGVNTIYVEAKNSVGSAGSEKFNVRWQLEPSIVWVLPSSTPLNATSGTLEIKASIKSRFDLQNVTVNINDKPVPVDAAKISRMDNDTYLFEHEIPLQPGANKVHLNAGNAKGFGFSNIITVNYAPGNVSEIEWINPVGANMNTSNAVFPLSATIKTKEEVENIRVYLNGKEIMPTGKQKITRKNELELLYENSIALQPGSNSVELMAITGAGTITAKKRTIDYSAPSLPLLAWVYPGSDRSEVSNSAMEIRMTIKSDAAVEKLELLVNGKTLEHVSATKGLIKENDNYILSSNLQLSPGDNSVKVIATNNAGAVTSETRNIKYTIPSKPVITWGSPQTNLSSALEKGMVISASITSTSELKDLKFFHNGVAATVAPDALLLDKSQGLYRFEKPVNLNPGENKLYFIAENLAGQSTSEMRIINIVAASAPEISWISPSMERTDINLNSAKVRAKITSADKLQSLLVYVNGSASEEINMVSPPNSNGEYTLEKSVNFQPGENNIYIVASNPNGTKRSDTRYLTNPPSNPPEVSWTIPVDTRALVNSEIITIEACIKSSTELKSAQIFVNGVQQASEMIFQSPQPGDCNYRLNKQVILKEGENSVFIIASNFAGSTNSDRRIIKYETASLAEKRIALIIGNANYGSSNSLKNPVNDANLIEGTLKSMGFDIIKRTNATKDQMMESLREFSKKLPDYNVALFYYAGHGIQVDGQNYLIPVDATLNEKTDCKWEAVAVNSLVEEFERVPDNVNIVILDACRNNPFRSWVRGGEQGFRALNPVSGTIVSFATSEGSTAADGTGANGTYTEELVKQIVVPQSISSVFINTRKEVMKRTNNSQRPQEWNMLTGEFYFKR